jgi:branched-chain amino acid transport system substrate-binding protein
MRRSLLLSLAVLSFSTWPALAEFSDGKIVIGVMGDQSGVVADVGGPGSIVAAKLAVTDAGAIDGTPVEIVTADHQNKPDVASTIAREWFDQRGVDAIVDLPHSGVVFGLIPLAAEKKRSLLISGAASTEITGRQCSPYVTHWTDDTYALAQGTAISLLDQGLKSWFFLTADYSFGHDLEDVAQQVVTERSGSVLGSARHPLGTADFSTLLIRARSSGAQVIALASAGSDTVNAIKQAGQFGIARSGQRLAALHAFVTDINSIGLETAQNLIISTGFYWDDNEQTRSFARRFFAIHGRMPTREQAGVYMSVLHYLKAARAAKSDDASTVNEQMRLMPVDRFGHEAHVQVNGRVTYDIGVYRVKMPASVAFRPASASGCSLKAAKAQ